MPTWTERGDLKRWSQDELDFLRENYDELTWKEIGDVLERTSISVKRKAYRMSLKHGLKGRLNPAYKHGKLVDKYVKLYGKYECPYADEKGNVNEHVYVWWQRHGATIMPGEIVHHKDGNTHNNLIENLVKISRAEHGRIHGVEIAKTRNRANDGTFAEEDLVSGGDA
jgi:hypothetical protein